MNEILLNERDSFEWKSHFDRMRCFWMRRYFKRTGHFGWISSFERTRHFWEEIFWVKRTISERTSFYWEKACDTFRPPYITDQSIKLRETKVARSEPDQRLFVLSIQNSNCTTIPGVFLLLLIIKLTYTVSQVFAHFNCSFQEVKPRCALEFAVNNTRHYLT